MGNAMAPFNGRVDPTQSPGKRCGNADAKLDESAYPRASGDEGWNMQDQEVDEHGLQMPRLVRIFREQDRIWKNREIGPPPVWDGNMRRSRVGVYGGPWPSWKRGLFRLTSAACFLPARLSDFD